MYGISNNKTIAKNSIMLYVRTFFIMAIGFYTSRVVLDKLGQEDYGIYSLVGSFVGLIAFLNSAMYGATSRFLTVALGKGDQDFLKKTFAATIFVHFWMAVFVLVVGETFGLWFINTQLVIPPERMLAANVVYQTSLFILILGIMQVPFVSSIISRERMGVYAYVDIMNFILKLVIVFIMASLPYDHLITFSILMFAVALLIFLVYYTYTARRFEECGFFGKPDKKICRELTSFFGFNMVGNFGSIFNVQAISVLLNRFFGLIFNAANGIATTVSNIVNALTGNMMVAFTPPITKAVASKETDRAEDLTRLAMTMSLFFFALFAIPVVVETETIMRIWLGEGKVPQMSETFCRLILAGMMFEIIRRIAIINIHATGKLQLVSICIGILLTLNPFVAWVVLRNYPHASLTYVCTIVANCVLAVFSILLIKRYLKVFNPWILLWIVLKMLVVTGLVLVVCWWLKNLMEPTLLRVLVTGACSTILLCALTYVLCLTKDNRGWVLDYFAGKLKFARFKKGR